MNRHAQNTILVVDDDQGILESFDAMLGDDYRLHLAENGFAALQMLQSHHPRLIFLDLKIPRPNGLEVLDRMKALGLSAQVVIVTAMPQAHFEQAAARYGVFRYLHKPLDVDEIIDIARRLLH